MAVFAGDSLRASLACQLEAGKGIEQRQLPCSAYLPTYLPLSYTMVDGRVAWKIKKLGKSPEAPPKGEVLSRLPTIFHTLTDKAYSP